MAWTAETEDPRPILVVDDEPSMRQMLSIMLRQTGREVEAVETGSDAIARLEAGERFAVVLTDLQMPGGISGLDVLRAARREDEACQVVLMTAFASAETALEALREGAYDYLIKPFKVGEAKAAIARALEKHDLVAENHYLRGALGTAHGAAGMIGESEAMQRVFDLIARVAPSRATVLLTGESGTGKEVAARSIHRLSRVAHGPFVPLNCGAIPANLIESELFGHVKGAFTGATSQKAGIFEAASGGTVFLDEVGELPMPTQVSFLRVLQERRVRPVGAAREIEVDCRIVAATNRDLKAAIEQGEFREDLYYRLNVIHLELPPLRERGGDVRLLIEHYLRAISDELGVPVRGIDPDAMRALIDHTWPGNVRELRNVMERAVTLARHDVIELDDLPFGARLGPGGGLGAERSEVDVSMPAEFPAEGLDLEGMVADLEIKIIERALEHTGGNRTEAAKLLGVSFRSLRYRLDKYGIQP